jgi:Rieske 2Fe-2S family protein
VTLRRTLDPSAYLDEQVWRVERERIWFDQWVLVGRADDLTAPGDRLLVDLAGESVLVVRDDAGRLFAHYNVCRHRGAQLVDPSAPACDNVGAAIRCPYHAWTYRHDGSLRRAPFVDDAERAELGDVRLHGLAVDTWAGFVFVHAGDEPPPLAAQLGPIPDRTRRYPLAELRCGATLTYEVAANWKVIAENYNECYHCGPVHPELCDLVPAFRRGGAALDWPDGIPHRDGAWTFTTTGTSARRPFPGLDAAERTRHKGELVYPNLLLSLSAEHVAAFRLVPRGPGATTVVCDLLFHPEALAEEGFDASDAVELWDLVNRQDWSICESVQRGMSSRAWRGGWFAPMEDETADITVWYAARMDARSVVRDDGEHGGPR